MDELRWASAVAQAELLRRGEVSAAELRAVAVEAVEAVDPAIGSVVIPLFDRRATGCRCC